jgi:hypothetical protein
MLGVSTRTVRNYIRAGRLLLWLPAHCQWLTELGAQMLPAQRKLGKLNYTPCCQ